MRQRSKVPTAITALFVLVCVWVLTANVVFAFRHPWATETERFLHFFDAMQFKQIPYEQMRPREHR